MSLWTALIPAIVGAGATIFGSAQNRSNIKDQYAYQDEENDETREYNLEMIKLQAALQDDDQDAQQKQFVIIGAGIAGIFVLIIIIMIIKALLK